MSALSLPHRPAPSPQSRHLRLVEPRPTSRSLAPTGPAQARRRRMVAVLLVLLAGAVLLVLLLESGDASAATVTPSASTATSAAETVVVEPGESLWDVAAVHGPADVATGQWVDRLARANGITDGAVEPWQVLVLPGG